MSSVYVLEPPTKGKVVLSTSMGPIDIELWPKEAPKAVRNFVQLCLEGYYDRNIFHRIIKSFLVQSGDPTSTGTGGESIYGAPFADEFHSRLRFNHRGLVACANAGPPHSNGSQFFITLDRCDWLDKKNTIFGKVTGDSIFNLLRIGEVETNKEDQPLDPQPTILSVEVLWNPFDDIIPRQMPNRCISSKQEGEKNLVQKKKAVKKLNLLSFGEEAEEDEKELAAVKEKIQSLHDVIDDPRFLKEETQDLSSIDIEKKKDAAMTVRGALMKKGDIVNMVEESIPNDDDDEDGARFDARMRQQILRKRQERGEMGTKEKSTNAKNAKSRSPSPSRDTVGDDSQQSRIKKLSIKKKGIGSEGKANQMAKADVDLQLLGHAEQERHLLKLKKRRLQGRGDDTQERLNKFKQKISAKLTLENFEVKDGETISGKPTIENSRVDSDEDEDLSGWMTNELKFAPESSSSKDGMARKDDPNDYVVVDPLLEKGKQKFNKMQAKMKRRKREWAGKTLT